MIYNIDFLLASLIFLLLILYHYLIQNKVSNTNSSFFMFFLLISMCDVFMDILCTILISMTSDLTALKMVCLTLFYFIQVLIPYTLLFYAKSLRHDSLSIKDCVFSIWTVLPVIMEVLVFFNCQNGIFFFFRDGQYFQGPLYMYMYYYALLYTVVVAISSIIHFRALGLRKFLVIWEFLLITTTCIIVQAVSSRILLTGFGLTLGITVLFLTINNPYEYIDNLTGVLDSHFFSDWIQKQMNRGKSFHLVVAKLPHLRKINSAFGNETGDYLLIHTAHKLREIHPNNQVFRISGNCFVLVSSTLSEYEKIRDTVRNYFDNSSHGDKNPISTSGIICGILNAEKLKKSDSLLAYVDYLTALAPDSDESLLIQGDEKTLQGFRYEKEVENFLPEAIEKDLFELCYQPVYSIHQKEYITLEALSRLRHPKLGPIPPDLFIQIAEKNGQIEHIGYLQFRKICCFFKEHRDTLDKIQNVKVNLSPAELLKGGHIQRLIELIQEYELPYSLFQFEITETVATEYSETLYQAVKDFVKIGIGLCLDDFGSGYANLNTVLKLPFSAIKLDRSLLSGILDNDKIARFYQSIVSSLQNMGYHVIAEGIEEQAEMELVSQWGVDLIQGYYFSEPLSPQKLIAKLSQ